MKKENEFKVEALCGNCKNFVSAQNGKIYTRQAGLCKLLVKKVTEINQNGVPEVKVIPAPQIFAYFHCSNNHFEPK